MPIDFKIDTAQFAKIETFVRDTANAALSSSDLKAEVGAFAVERVKYQARIGAPFNAAGTFPPLKDSTIKNRKYLAKNNPPHATFSPDFSNLTITGQLLDSLIWLDEGGTTAANLRIAFSGMHPVYVGNKGQRISKTIMNETLAKYLALKGFNVFDKSLNTNAQFLNRIKTICLGYIRRGLKVRNKLSQG